MIERPDPTRVIDNAGRDVTADVRRLDDRWRDLRRGQRDTILPVRTWKRAWWHRRPAWSVAVRVP